MKKMNFPNISDGMLIKEHRPEKDTGFSSFVNLLKFPFERIFFILLSFLYRETILKAKPIMMHLENDIFPDLREKREKWFYLEHSILNDKTTLFGKSGNSDYTFPGTGEFCMVLQRIGLQKVKLNTSLEYNQILDAFIVFLFVRKFFQQRSAGFHLFSSGRKRIAESFLSESGYHRFCADMKYDPDLSLFEIEYSYCELTMTRLINRYTLKKNRFGDHRVFFVGAPVVSGGLFLVFLIPYLFYIAGFNIIGFLWFILTFFIPLIVWFIMYLVGSIQYEKEHDELLKKEYIRHERVLARLPETNPNLIIKIGRDGDIMYANPAARELARSLGTGMEQILPHEYNKKSIESGTLDSDELEINVQKRCLRYLVSEFPEDCSRIFSGNDITDLRNTESKLRELNSNLEQIVEQRTSEIYQTQDAAIICLAGIAEVRDPETGAHIERTRTYVKTLAEKLALHDRYKSSITESMINILYKSAPLHDIGKVGIPDSILLKPGKLTDDEFQIMKKHSEYGAQALNLAAERLGFDSFLNSAAEIAESHHEKWDGSGYPHGLSGGDIPISARLMAVADVYDALISKRVYKKAFSHEKAVSIILGEKGKHFDPDIVDVFYEIQDIFCHIAQEFPDNEIE